MWLGNAFGEPRPPCRLRRPNNSGDRLRSHMGYDLRPMSANKLDSILLALRGEITAADRDLVVAFTHRLQAASKIRAHKADSGYDFIDLEREQQLLEEWRQANDGAISDETLLELFETVLRLSKSEATRER